MIVNQKVTERLSELVAEGNRVAGLAHGTPHDGRRLIREANIAPLSAWVTSSQHILDTTFGRESVHADLFRQIPPALTRHQSRIYERVGILQGALADLEGGFLFRYEELVAAEIFDSLVEQARSLQDAGYDDPAAVLGRIVVEDALRRIARREGVDPDRKASVLDDDLHKAGHFSKPRWRMVQAWLDIGNAAAHGDFGAYDSAGVSKMLDAVEVFVAETIGQ